MTKELELDSKEELDNLVELFANTTAVLPSDVLKLYDSVEQFIVRIHQLGYTAGYEKGVEMKERIKKNL